MLIPLAVYPAYGQVQPVSKAHHNLHNVHLQTSLSAPTTPIPFVKISQLESQAPFSVPAVPAIPTVSAPAAVQAVRFVPCLCSGNKEDRWSKTNYQGNAHYVNTAPFQAIQLLPCYCPLVREFESQYVQQAAAVSPADQQLSNNGPSTVATKSLNS